MRTYLIDNEASKPVNIFARAVVTNKPKQEVKKPKISYPFGDENDPWTVEEWD